jgi:hypothetical protein
MDVRRALRIRRSDARKHRKGFRRGRRASHEEWRIPNRAISWQQERMRLVCPVATALVNRPRALISVGDVEDRSVPKRATIICGTRCFVEQDRKARVFRHVVARA